MAQVLSKEYTCFNCKKTILISKIDNPVPGSKKKWEQWELDSVTPHQCKKEEQHEQQKQEQQQSNIENSSTELRSIFELLQLINQKVDKLLQNNGTKTP